jgi:hypothetical protein
MTTPLDSVLKRELTIGGEPYTLTISPEGFSLTIKGHRNGLDIAWADLVGGDAALATALNASLTANIVPRGKPAAPSKAKATPPPPDRIDPSTVFSNQSARAPKARNKLAPVARPKPVEKKAGVARPTPLAKKAPVARPSPLAKKAPVARPSPLAKKGPAPRAKPRGKKEPAARSKSDASRRTSTRRR